MKVAEDLVKGLNTIAGRKRFIDEMENDLYCGHTEEGLEVRVAKGDSGLKVSVEQPTKPNWWLVLYYDADGYLEGDSVEPRRGRPDGD